MSSGRTGTGRMDNQVAREKFAEMHARAVPRQEIADEFGVHIDTISVWAKREDVQAIEERIIRERANQILRRVDSKIESLMQRADDLSLEELLRVRREFVPHEIKFSGRLDSTPALEELLAAYLADPDETIRKLASSRSGDSEG